MEKYRILYEDDTLFVLWKASGVPVQSARVSVPDVMSMLRNDMAERGAPAFYPGLVNRLDQPVEGLFLVAKNEKAAAELGRQINDHVRMEKWYEAVVCGKLPREKGNLVDYLIKDGRANRSRAVPEGTKGAKRSELHYEVQKEEDGKSFLRIRLLTGQHHQIRVQLAHAGAPIAGDRKYGKADTGYDRLLLCACEITFIHPKTGEKMHFREAPTFGPAS